MKVVSVAVATSAATVVVIDVTAGVVVSSKPSQIVP